MVTFAECTIDKPKSIHFVYVTKKIKTQKKVMKTSSKALEVTDKNFEELVKSGKPVLIDFWAEWCGPCVQLSPIIEAVAEKYDGKAIIGKVNVDDNQQLSMKFGIRSIPTVMIFKDGEMVERMVGLVSQKNLETKLDGQIA